MNIRDFELEEEYHYHKRKFNKEKYCKKNKIGNGLYGLHNYVNGRCIACNKIDPKEKIKEQQT